MQKINRTLLGCAVAAGLAGCATTPDVIVQQRTGAIQQCESVGWTDAGGESLREQTMRNEISADLKAKGYTEVAGNPACRLTNFFEFRERIVGDSGPRVGVGGGGGSGGSYGGVGISLPVGKRKDLDGSYTLRVIDAGTNQEIWSGSLTDSYATEQLSETEARAVAQKVLAKLPAKNAP